MIHRADYHQILLDEATAVGAKIQLGATVVDVDFEKTEVLLDNGAVVQGDVIVGADGT